MRIEESLLQDSNCAAPRDYYAACETLAKKDADRLERTLVQLGRYRLGASLASAAAFLLMETSPREMWLPLVSWGLAAGVLFLALVRRYRRVARDLHRARLRETLSQEALARLARDWDALPSAPVLAAPQDHPYSDDLDIVGRASLAHLIGRVTTAPGRAVLRQLLLNPFTLLPATASELLSGSQAEVPTPTQVPEPGWLESVRERQEAARVLAEQRALREEIEYVAREARMRADTKDTERFLQWLSQPGWLNEHRWYLYAGRVLAIGTPVSLATWLFGWTPGILPVLGAVAAHVVHRVIGPHASAHFSAAEAGDGDLRTWSSHLTLAGQLPGGTAVLERLRESASQPAPGAARAIQELRSITETAGVRRSALIHFPLVTLFAWDVHLLDRLERWHSRHATAAVRWVHTVGELEVLAALGGLVHDHPDWCFPEFIDGPPAAVRATAMGHPLLKPGRCVRNDVVLPSPGHLVVVTGSNMAGKTTLLRAIGINQVLALVGGPVAAERMETRPLFPWCAMRVRDNLESGVSYFLAELRRLKRVVDAAEGGPILYLLDEVLQGTNSAERRTAARIVLSKLVRTSAIGAITTHDLALVSTEDLQPRVIEVHFREEVVEQSGAQTLEFDYLLRPGPATSRNALLLLQMVGLESDDDQTSEDVGPGTRSRPT